MNESNHDFSNAMPLNNEQKMLVQLEEIAGTLKRVEVLLTPVTVTASMSQFLNKEDLKVTQATAVQPKARK